jgi:hypothetical protein
MIAYGMRTKRCDGTCICNLIWIQRGVGRVTPANLSERNIPSKAEQLSLGWNWWMWVSKGKHQLRADFRTLSISRLLYHPGNRFQQGRGSPILPWAQSRFLLWAPWPFSQSWTFLSGLSFKQVNQLVYEPSITYWYIYYLNRNWSVFNMKFVKCIPLLLSLPTEVNEWH